MLVRDSVLTELLGSNGGKLSLYMRLNAQKSRMRDTVLPYSHVTGGTWNGQEPFGARFLLIHIGII